jgi:hypothetical protein
MGNGSGIPSQLGFRMPLGEEMTGKKALIANIVLVLGVIYGSVAFLIGVAASFTLNGRDFIESLIGLVMGFLAILPIAILAIWKPRSAAILLAICLIAVECAGFANDGVRGAILVAEKLALPDVLLICGYAFVASTNIWKRSV